MCIGDFPSQFNRWKRNRLEYKVKCGMLLMAVWRPIETEKLWRQTLIRRFVRFVR